MSDPAISIWLDDNGRLYQPGETLSGRYAFESVALAEVKAVEVSVLWYTEGKGDEDLAVHEFWRSGTENGHSPGLQQRKPFRTVLPKSPLSYDGVILKLRWCVRVRAFLRSGRELVGQREFRLGEVPAVEVSAP